MSASVDLRSDTVTLPTLAMQRAMAGADLGDDVFGEDPTVNRLLELAAARLGKESAIFMPSGTMGNLVGILLNARSGEEVIADADSHVFLYETGGAAAVGGVQIRPLATSRGIFSASQVLDAIRPLDDVHQPLTAAVCIENTHNRHGGVAWPLEALEEISSLARERGVRVHLDGARLFNAAVATGADPARIAACADTVTFCISKGLGCPGSVLCASSEAIARAQRWRKMLGGGMRQAGVLAAPGIVALESGIERLAYDHANARALAEGLAELPCVEIDLSRVQTNIVLFRLSRMTAAEFLDGCRRRGVLGIAMGADLVRFVTHQDVSPAGVATALAAAAEVVGSGFPAPSRS